MMYFRDNGVALVSFGLIANEEKLKANPDLYKRFVAASLKGLAAAMKNPEAGVDALRKNYPELRPRRRPWRASPNTTSRPSASRGPRAWAARRIGLGHEL